MAGGSGGCLGRAGAEGGSPGGSSGAGRPHSPSRVLYVGAVYGSNLRSKLDPRCHYPRYGNCAHLVSCTASLVLALRPVMSHNKSAIVCSIATVGPPRPLNVRRLPGSLSWVAHCAQHATRRRLHPTLLKRAGAPVYADLKTRRKRSY